MSASASYIKSLRSAAKRDYAEAFDVYYRNGSIGPEPERGALSAMAAQAVRLNIYDFYKEAQP